MRPLVPKTLTTETFRMNDANIILTVHDAREKETQHFFKRVQRKARR